MFSKLKFVIIVCCGIFSVVGGAGKYIKPQQYNEAVIMAHILGSGSLNMMHFFHILGIDCENKDREYYRFADEDFKLCLNRTDLLPLPVRSKPYGSVDKACELWRYNKGCYEVYKDDLDDCGINDKNTIFKARDAYRFTEAYAKYICRDPDDTELHLIDRFTRRDIIAPGVFICFPNLQERIVNCIKKDGYSYATSLCSKLYTVRNCFANYFSEEYCDDDDVIIFMEDMFYFMTNNLKCPRSEDEWLSKLEPTPAPYKPKTTTYGYGYPIKSSTYSYGGTYPTKRTTPFSFETYDPYPSKSTPYGSSKSTTYGYGQPSKKPKSTAFNYGSGFPYY